MPTQPLHKAWVSPEVHDKILAWAFQTTPHEACGIVTPTLTVIPVPNRADEPHREFLMEKSDLIKAIDEYVVTLDFDPDQLYPSDFILWHSHPGGLIGPSAKDLEETSLFQRLVITLPGGEVTLY